MSFSFNNGTLRIGWTHNQGFPKKSVKTGITANASETYYAEKISVFNGRISTELVEEKNRANLKPINEQISTLTQLFNQLIQNKLAKSAPTAVSRTHRPQTGPSPLTRQRNWTLETLARHGSFLASRFFLHLLEWINFQLSFSFLGICE